MGRDLDTVDALDDVQPHRAPTRAEEIILKDPELRAAALAAIKVEHAYYSADINSPDFNKLQQDRFTTTSAFLRLYQDKTGDTSVSAGFFVEPEEGKSTINLDYLEDMVPVVIAAEEANQAIQQAKSPNVEAPPAKPTTTQAMSL